MITSVCLKDLAYTYTHVSPVYEAFHWMLN